MTDKKVVIRTDGHEEQFDVEVNGKSIAHFSYDAHGSAAMQDARALIERLGVAFGFEVVREEAGGEDEEA
jgi:hypothetical protein